MKDFKKYIAWCKENRVKSSNAKTLDLYFMLCDLGAYDEITAICEDKEIPACDLSLIDIVKLDCPEIRA